MREELENKIYERFPKFFNRSIPPVQGGFWGLGVGDGWYSLLHNLFEKIEPIVQDLDGFHVQQIKEKFGILRAYMTHSADPAIDHYISIAENESETTCELCGNEGKIRKNGWWKVKCDQCYNEKEK